MKLGKTLTTLALALSAALPVFAQQPPVPTAPATPGEELNKIPARQGWFWYRDPVEKKAVEPAPPVKVEQQPQVEAPRQPLVVVTGAKPASEAASTPLSREQQCGSRDTWEATCGFIDPGDDFEFQSKQRDSLLQQMSLRPQDPDAVEAAQRYMKWVVRQASLAANMWYFNMVQKPDLDPTVKSPISEVGLALASRVKDASQQEYFRLIREEGGVLFFFSRDDCIYCHDQAPYTQRVARTMGVTLINIPLDGKCLPGFEGEACEPNIPQEQIAKLNVQIVPTLFLYVPSNTWIRLGTGITTDSTILANTVNFFSAYRSALIQGLDNSKGTGRPSVSFDPEVRGTPTGVTKADGSQPVGLPDRTKLMELLGYGGKGGAK